MKTLKRISALLLAVLLMASFSITAFAGEYDIGTGSVTVNATTDTQTVTHGSNTPVTDSSPVITGASTSNTVTINADSGATANVTLSDVNIDVSSERKAAVSTSGAGNVTIELDGNNTAQSGQYHAGVEKNNSGSLTITDDSGSAGSLDATGGLGGAGIGGGDDGNANNITINGGTVNATGGQSAAGIGAGRSASAENITFSGGEVYATSDSGGAGIGGGMGGSASNITVSGSAVVNVSDGGCDPPVGSDSGKGAHIGGGGTYQAYDGTELTPGSGLDISRLCTGEINYYNSEDYSPYAGVSIDYMKNNEPASTVTGIGHHTEVTDPAVAPTETATGLTEGSHCEVCGDILTPQQVVPKLKPDPAPVTPAGPVAPVTYKLKFDLGGGVMPDGKTELELKCSAGQKITLPEAPTREGFTFVGWETTIRGKTVILDAGAKFTVTAAKTFVALWEEA